MPKAKKREMAKSKVLLVLSIETPVEPEDDEQTETEAYDDLFDGLVSPDMEAAMNETLRNWYLSEAQISIADAVTVELPSDKRQRPQFKLTRGGGLIQTV